MAALNNTRVKRGFTLLEIMVVMSIIAIIMTITLPMAFKARKKDVGAVAMETIRSVCADARTDAILNRRIRHVYLDLEGQERRIELLPVQSMPGENEDGAGAPTKAKPPPLRSEILPQDVTVTPGEAYTLTFRPDGTCDGFELDVRYTSERSNQDKWFKVVLDEPTSRVYISSVE